MKAYQTPLLAEPAVGRSFYDPVFGSCMARLTNRQSDPTAGDMSNGMHVPGANLQAFNADSSLVLARSSANFWYLYDTSNLNRQGILPFFGSNDVIWDPVDPSRLYFIQDTEVYKYHLETRLVEPVHDFSADFPMQNIARVTMKGAYSTSMSGKYWGLLGENANGTVEEIIVFNREDNLVLSHRPLPGGIRANEVMITPLGNKLLVHYETTCQPADESSPSGQYCGLVAYDLDLTHSEQLLTVVTSFDSALDAQSREVLVYHDPIMNSISMMDLRTKDKVALWLFDISQSTLVFDISGRATHKPGWALISTFNLSQRLNPSRMENEILAVQLTPNGRIVRIAHNYSAFPEAGLQAAESSPQATPNHSFTRIIFSSNWGTLIPGVSDVYLIALPDDWIAKLP